MMVGTLQTWVRFLHPEAAALSLIRQRGMTISSCITVDLIVSMNTLVLVYLL